MLVQPHFKWFRHSTSDETWLEMVGEKKWIVLKRDQKIGRNLLELDALLAAKVRSFVLVEGGLKDAENATIIIAALPKILTMLDENHFPFIARIRQDSSVTIWKTEPKIHKGIQRKKRKK